ncbi:hypothetical protein ACNQFN_11505 [Thauera butanivorans]|uniref:hypothetical protein n=1 Tax=Thauera butanivorans TaxID=86174 RepID=UPI003AB75644
MASAPFAVNPTLTAIAIAYVNPLVTLIADRVLPRKSTGETFVYTRYDKAAAYTVPDTTVGRKGRPNFVEFDGAEVVDRCLDYGLDAPVPNRDIKLFADMPKAPGAKGPLEVATMMLTNLMLLSREVRVAQLVFNAATYPAANKAKLTGDERFSDHANSDPLGFVLEKLDVPLVRPNVMVFGQEAWTQFRVHPDIVQACKGGAQQSGTVTRQQVAELFEVNEVLVGAGRHNVARKGQQPNFQRCWGKHIALLSIDQMAAETDQPTFGWTAQWGAKVAGTINDPDIGIEGGVRVRSGEHVKEVISAPDAAFFIEDAVA